MLAWAPFIEMAIDGWDRASGLEFTAVPWGAGADIRVTTLREVQAPAEAKGWAVFWSDDVTEEIQRGFVGLTGDVASLSAGEARWMALHEVGHVLGLSHPLQAQPAVFGDQSQTVMAYARGPDGVWADRPMPLDVAAIQTLYGPDDLIVADGSGVLRHGGPGYDVILGDDADDVAHGNEDPDHLHGHRGDDSLHGGQGADTLHGGQGADTLHGDLGDDVLHGDMGDDVLSGGLGADIFVVGPNGGRDRVVDFDAAAGDRVRLVGGVTARLEETSEGVWLDLGSGGGVMLIGQMVATLPRGWMV